jgi:hypothetical protein
MRYLPPQTEKRESISSFVLNVENAKYIVLRITMPFSEYLLLILLPLSNAQKKKTNHDNFVEGNETMVQILVDNNIIEAEDGANLLQTVLKMISIFPIFAI